MQTGTLAIYDLEKEYANSLMEFISDRQGIPLNTIAFTDLEPLLTYIEENHIDILLISASSMEKSIEMGDIGKIILLSSGNILPEYAGYTSIYKYQSGENIIREVLTYYADMYQEQGMVTITKGSAEIIGIYSPVGRLGQTTFALIMGQVWAEEHSVLYINMEEFSAFNKILEQSYQGDLSDLMYYYKQNPASLPIRLQTIVNNLHGMNYVSPLLYSEDLRNISTEEWIDLIQSIAAIGTYEKIILDLSNMVTNIFQILNICNVIYMPIHDDTISFMKIAAYEEYLLQTDKENIFNKIIKVKPPKPERETWEEDYLEMQLRGNMGDFVRKIIRETVA